MSIVDIGRFQKKRNEENKTNENTFYDRLINYIHQPIIKSVGGFKDKIVSLFNTNTPKQTVYGRGKKLSKPNKLSKPKRLSKPKKQNMKKPFISEENKEKIENIIF